MSILTALKELIADPAGNASATGALIGILVLAVLVVVLLLLAASTPGRSRRIPEQATADLRSSRGRARAIVAVSVTLGLIAALVTWYQLTSSERYCAQTCHQMAAPSQSWKESAHASVTCVRCHEGRPWSSIGQGITGRSESLYLYVTNSKGKGRPVPESICLECHRGMLDETITARNREPYTHRDDFDEGRRCASCHGQQGHEKPVVR